MLPPSLRSGALALLVSSSLSACVERAAPVQGRPDVLAVAAAMDGAAPRSTQGLAVPIEVRDGQVSVAYRAPLRACDDACMRGRGGAMLRLLRLAHQMPQRIRRVLQAIDIPYARVWMAWLAKDGGDEADARAYLAEAREVLQQDAARRAAYQSLVSRVASGATPTFDDELVAEMRAQLDHWASIDPELGAEMARVLPCAVLARSGPAVALAFRASPTSAPGDGDARRVALRCGEAMLATVPEADALAARSSVAQTLTAITALTAATQGPDASVTVSDALRLRVLEPFFAPAYREPALDDAALGRFARAPQGAMARTTLPLWLRSRTPTMNAYASALCAVARRSQLTPTDAQCAERARNAVNSAAKWWIEASAGANVAVGEGQRDR